uniref:Reverse transcriptase n=1 Tax=Amphimedon queenslandica TaxID=400682 RepID=A0A1X7TPJ2_AMPQE
MSVAECMSRFIIRSLAKDCGFGAQLDVMLRDRLICGINDAAIQKRLLSEGDDLTLKDALQHAMSLELAMKDLKELHSNGLDPVHSTRAGGEGRHPKPHNHNGQHHTAGVGGKRNCYRCGQSGHAPDKCRYKTATCFNCNKTGHISSVCRSNPRRSTPSCPSDYKTTDRPVHDIHTSDTTDTRDEYSFTVRTGHTDPIIVDVLMDNVSVKMELDTGSSVSIMSLETFRSHFPFKVLEESSLNTFKDLFRRVVNSTRKDLLCLVVTPKFYKPRPIPYAYKKKVEDELQRLSDLGIVSLIQFSEWAAPIVPVLKSDKVNVRICGDYSVTVNKASKLESYPIPKLDDLLAALSGGTIYTKLDMSQAYQQLELDDDSKCFTVINTHKGLFTYNRLPFGISSAPAIFQRVMESLLQDILNVAVYIDDILVAGKSHAEHIQTLERVFSRLHDAGLRLKKEKCTFCTSSVQYLGFRINKDGLHPTAEKIRAIKEAPTPTNIMQLKAYLGLLSYYNRFLPHLPSTLAPLYELLHHNVTWNWSPDSEAAFIKSKELLTDDKCLVHFDSTLPLLLACDASQYGVGAVLAHRFPDAYEYDLHFKSSTNHANADALSRLPLSESISNTPLLPKLILLMENIANSPVTAKSIAAATKSDSTLSLVLQYLKSGWPDSCPDDSLKPYWHRQHELSLHDGCILWASRVVIPAKFRQQLLLELHEGHFGITKLKARARSCIWWPNIDTAIEEMVKSCSSCQENHNSPPEAPIHPWPWPSRPWSRLHIDFAGPLKNNTMLLVIVDAFSKWIEVFPVSTVTSSATISKLKMLFAQFGLPDTIVSDNGPSLVSQEFKSYLTQYGIRHITCTSSPYHPASNGLAERAVQLVKNGLKKDADGTLSERLACILLNYRVIPHGTTGISPSELMFGRIIKSKVDLVKPDLTTRVENNQYKQKDFHDQHSRTRKFLVGEGIMYRNFSGDPKWKPGKITKYLGSLSFLIQGDD